MSGKRAKLQSMVGSPYVSLFPLLVHTHFMDGARHNTVVEFVLPGGLLTLSLVMGIWDGSKKLQSILLE